MTVLKRILAYVWQLPLCTLAFMVGMVAGGMLLPALGLQVPPPPAGTDAATIMLWMLLGSPVLGLALSFLSPGLHGRYLARWLALGVLAWVAGAVNTALEAAIFMTAAGTSSGSSLLFTVLSYLLPSFALAAVVAWLFPPAAPSPEVECGIRARWRSWAAGDWAWRLAAVLVAFPAIYIIFGVIVQPLIIEYYRQGAYELTTPSWSQIIPLQLARSTLFLLACLPVLAMWRHSWRRLFVALGLAMYALLAFLPIITAYWLPWQLRLFHGLELLADALTYVGVLTLLLARPHAGMAAGARTQG